MREEAIKEYLKKAGENYKAVEMLLHDGKLKEVVYERYKFYVRDLSPKKVQ